MTTVNTDIDTLASEPVPVTLESGTEIEIVRLKTRQLMKLLKIITSGAASVLGELSFSADMDPEEFTGNLIGAVILAIPEAEDETIEFLQTMVAPKGLIVDPRTKPEQEVNIGLEDALRAELQNPELEDLVTILEQIFRNEGPHILALGKRLAVLLAVQKKAATAKASVKQRVSSVKSSKA